MRSRNDFARVFGAKPRIIKRREWLMCSDSVLAALAADGTLRFGVDPKSAPVGTHG